MGKAKFEQAKSKWPKDTLYLEKGYVEITGKYAGLRRFDWTLFLGLVSVIGAFAWVYFLSIPIAIVTMMLVWRLLTKQLSVRISADSIRVRGKNYARTMPIEFRVETHHRAFLPNPGIYTRALEVLMQYGEKRVQIATMRDEDQEKAVALAFRLQGWCENFDKALALAAQRAAPGAARAQGDFGPAPDVR